MRYRSAAFARLSAHALAGDGSTHFPARPGRGARGARRLSRVTIARECASTAAAPSPRIEFVTQLRAPTTTTTRC